jgi:hypothetical protein
VAHFTTSSMLHPAARRILPMGESTNRVSASIVPATTLPVVKSIGPCPLMNSQPSMTTPAE